MPEQVLDCVSLRREKGAVIPEKVEPAGARPVFTLQPARKHPAVLGSLAHVQGSRAQSILILEKNRMRGAVVRINDRLVLGAIDGEGGLGQLDRVAAIF